MTGLTLRVADRTAVPLLLDMRAEAAAWILAETGSDQWQRFWPSREVDLQHLIAALDDQRVLLVDDDTGPVATITIHRVGEASLWTPAELATPALYVTRFIVRPAARGNGLGGELLNWVGTLAAVEHRRWLRLDAWTTNTLLHAYHRRQRFRLVRVADAGDRPSTALFERPAVWSPTPRLPDPTRWANTGATR